MLTDLVDTRLSVGRREGGWWVERTGQEKKAKEKRRLLSGADHRSERSRTYFLQ